MKKILKTIFFVFYLFLLPVLLLGLDQNLLNLFNQYASNPSGVTAEQQAYLFTKNAELQNMAGKGEISNEAYQKNQSSFQKLNDELSRKAAQKVGLEISKQASKTPGSYKAWTDTDNLVGKKDGNVTLEDIKRVRSEYNKVVNEHLAKSGVKAPANIDWAKRNETDFMPKAEQTREFTEINKWINKKGGTAYESREAARVEEAIRRNRTAAVSLKDAQKYNQEMTNQIDHKAQALEKTKALIEKIKAKNPQPGSANYDRIQKLEASSQKIGHQIAKYVTRKAEINNIVVEKFGVGEKTKLSREVIEAAKTRGPQTAKSAIAVGERAREISAAADRNLNNTVSNVSKVSQIKDAVSTSVEKAKFAAFDKANQIFGARNVRKAVTAPDRYIEKITGVSRGAPGSAQRAVLPNINSVLKYGAGALIGAKVFDIVMQTYRTGNYMEGVKNLGISYVCAKGGELAARHLLGGVLAANPVTATGIGVFGVSYGLTREVFSRTEIGGKTLDVHTQEWYDKQLFMSSRYDTEAKANLLKMYIDAINKGHKLPKGMSLSQGWDLIVQNYDKGGAGIFGGVLEAPNFEALDQFFNSAEKTVNSALKDPDIQPEEKKIADKIMGKIEYGENLIKQSTSKQQEGSSGSDNNITRYNKAQDAVQEIDKMLKELNFLFNKCILKIKIVDADTGTDIGKISKIHLYGQPDIPKEAYENGTVIYRGLNSGDYRVDVEAEGYYTKMDQQIRLDRSKKRIFSGTIKLIFLDKPVDYTAKQSEESKEIDENLKKIALNIKDAELEKAKEVLREFESLANDGIIVSRQTALDAKAERLSWAISRYASIKVSAIANIMMASDSTGTQPFLRNGAILCAANMLNKISYYLTQGRVEIKEIALMQNALKQPNDASGSKDASYAQAMLVFYKEYIENQTFNVSDIRYYKVYKEFQGNTKVTGTDKKDLSQRDAEYWLGIISKGGYKSVSTELDRIWSEDKKKLGVSEDKNFLSNNPFIIKDYRNKYIIESIAPLINEYTEANKIVKEKIVLAALNDFSAALNFCNISVIGSMDSSPESATITINLSCGKSKWDKKGVGAFNFTIPAKELEQDSFNISRKVEYPENMYTTAPAAGRSDYISLDIRRERVFYSVRMSGNNIEIKVDPYFCYAIKKIPYLNKPDNYDIKCAVPEKVETAEKVNKALSEAVNAVNSIDKIGYEKANYLFYCKEAETKMYLLNFNDSYYNMKRALSHNCDYEIRLARDEYKSSQAIRNRYKAHTDKLEGERKKVDLNVTQTLENLSKEKEKKFKGFVNIESDLNKKGEELKKSQEEERQKYYKSINEFKKILEGLFSQMKSAHRARNENSNFDFSNSEIISSKWIEESMSDFTSKTNEIKSIQSTISVLASSWKTCYDNDCKLASERQNIRLKISGPGAFDLSGNKVSYAWRFNIPMAKEYYLTSDMAEKLNLSKFITENEDRIKWYMQKRGAGLRDIDTIIAEAEKLSGTLPGEGEISDVNSKIGSVSGRVEKYVQNIQRAVMLEDVRNLQIPQGVIDSKGSDEAFVKECADIMRSLRADYVGVIGDMLPPSMFVETPYLKLQGIMQNIPWSEINEAQKKKLEDIRKKMEPMQMMYSRYPDIMKVYPIAIASSLEGLGDSPQQRVENIIKKNSEVIERIDSVDESITSGLNVSKAQNLIKEAVNWYGIMPDIATLDAIKKRSSLFEKIVKQGVFEKNRLANNLPPAPRIINILGKDIPYDGRCVIYNFSQLPDISAELAKAYDNTEWKGRFIKSLYYRLPKEKDFKLEYSNWNGEFRFITYYDSGKDAEWPIAKEYLPIQINIFMRYVSEKENKYSRVKYEPGVTILILP